MNNNGILTCTEHCMMLIEQAKKIFAKYSMSKEDIENIEGMIASGFYRANGCTVSNRTMERIIDEYCSQEGKCFCQLSDAEQMELYAKYHMEEDKKYPFGNGEDIDDEF